MSKFEGQAHQEKWVPVDFENAEIHPGEKPGSKILTVTGNAPRSSERGCPVKLVPAVYVAQPEYWVIKVMWDSADAIFTSLCPFNVSIPLDQICGTKGIEVVGKTRSVRLSC